jgi:hypothetical protein
MLAGPKEKEETVRLVLKSDWTSSIILVSNCLSFLNHIFQKKKGEL